MRFSQKIGRTPIKTILQVESMDIDLKNRLWNILLENFLNKITGYFPSGENLPTDAICKSIWKDFFNKPIDEIPTHYSSVHLMGFTKYIRSWFFNAEWYEIYDLIEHIIFIESKIVNLGFAENCNYALEKEVSGYRILNNIIVQITSQEEINEIEEATINSDKWQSVSLHLKTSLDLLADRKNPDYRNSIKESISSVESFCKIFTKDDNTTLGKALTEIEKSHKLHGALKTAFSALYGYTSDSGGIRHSLIESDEKPEFEDAKFMLVSCSAFINYLKAKMKI